MQVNMDTPIFSPSTCSELFARWDEHPEAQLIAGGTDLLVRLKDSLAWPVLIDISRLKELQGISVDNGTISIGALSTYSIMLHNAALQKNGGVLLQAAEMVGSPQIRNRGTIGGNIANGSPAGDTIPPLYVLEASVTVMSNEGTRNIPVDDFFTGPGETVLGQHEIIVSIDIPVQENHTDIFLRLGQRAAMAISKVSLAMSARVSNDKTEDIRIALGAVAPTVIRAEKTEKTLRGESLTEEILRSACNTIEHEAVPISDIRSDADYRRRMCGVLLRWGLQAVGTCEGAKV
jgi:CO/xanthine dehydrogenase FAD-binding subunit